MKPTCFPAIFTILVCSCLAACSGPDSGKPFFAYLAHTSPHWPLQAPAFFHYPRAMQSGVMNDSATTVKDVMPTLLELAGIDHPGAGPYRGREMLELWEHYTTENNFIYPDRLTGY